MFGRAFGRFDWFRKVFCGILDGQADVAAEGCSGRGRTSCAIPVSTPRPEASASSMIFIFMVLVAWWVAQTEKRQEFRNIEQMSPASTLVTTNKPAC